MMKVLFTCGGTAGHIKPAVALAGLFQKRNGAQILFVGADGGMENRLVPREGYEIRTVTITSFYRSLSASSLKHNLATLRNLSRSKGQAKRILDDFKPDLVVGTGGYASYPVVREAARRGIPTAVHESNAQPGLTTRMLAKYVDKVMVGFEESRRHYPHPERVEVTGTPVRGEFFELTRAEARQKLGFRDDKPVVLTSWGSLGKDYPDVDVREYIYDMPVAMGASDLVLSRAGASTISELTATTHPAILVPSPNVTAHHQEKNARVLSDRGGAVLMLEEQASGDKLYDTVRELLAHPDRLEQMRAGLRELAIDDANERIYQVLCNLIQ